MATERIRFEVLSSPKRDAILPGHLVDTEHQGNLFPAPRKGLLIFVYFPDVTEQEFRRTLSLAKPSNILELRSAPRFDIGNLNRHLAFRLFVENEATYIDLTSLGGKAWEPRHLLSYVRNFLSNCSRLSAERPLMILLSKSDSDPAMIVDPIRQLISSAIPQFTELFEVPHFSEREKSKATSV